ncbi:unnamed protein product [marine sediment metagenome]|uniref:Uncharacterized protein n=1 Tax=marine sediment metagenome TaxID=412755 RepID=X1IKM8_9ZZZZ
MKATITIEIEGNPEDINAITKNLQSFIKRQPATMRMTPMQGHMFPLNKPRHHRRMW